MSALSFFKKKMTPFYSFLFLNNLDNPQREKTTTGTETSWFGTVAGDGNDGRQTPRGQSPVLGGVGRAGGGRGVVVFWKVLASSSGPAPPLGNIRQWGSSTTAPSILAFPRNLGNSYPR